jgi:hypothetical protein
LQGFAEHRPLQQLPLQHSCAVVQLPPGPVHVVVHVPVVQAVPAQHSAEVPQVPPCGTQQTLPWHEVPEQHCDVLLHPLKSLPHGAHVPLLQMSEQQSLARTQVAPSFLHELHLEL